MRAIKIFFLSLITAVLFIAVPARAVLPPSRSFLLRPVLVPIEVVRSGHIAIRAKINGHGPYRFIFDTGAPSLVISEQVARDARILPADFQRPFFTPLGNLGNFDVRSISLGAATQQHLMSDIWNHPTVELLSRAYGRFEGLVGFPFFAHYQVTIDYKSKTLSLVPCDYQPADTQKKMTDRLTRQAEAKIWAATQSLGIRVSKTAGDDAAGVVITAVLAGSPAADAGFAAGDRLLVFDGRWTDSVDDCYAALSAVDAPRDVPAVLLHQGKKVSLQVKVVPGI
jgi:hypothetical protein